MKQKVILLAAAALVASATLTPAVAKKDKKVKKCEAKAAPVVLASSSDTISYAAGMSFTNGLIPYLQKSEGVDTAYMADFVRGFQQVINSGNDPKMKAYAAGMDIAKRVQSQMLPGMEKDLTDTPDTIVEKLLYRGFEDALNNDTTHYTAKKAEEVFRAKLEANHKVKEVKLRAAGEAFLAENAKKEGVVTLPDGLQYKVLTAGTGAIPQRTDKVQVNYTGKLIDGTEFDSNKKHGDKPATFRADQVIKGWTEALTMMPVGSKWQIAIPYQLAYGERGAGAMIKPYSALVFDVELVGIEAAKVDDKAADAKTVANGKKTADAKKKGSVAGKKSTKKASKIKGE